VGIDWSAIKTEYITTDTSYRKLAEKYGVHKDTIHRKAKDEGWADKRRQQIDKTQTRILEKAVDMEVDRATKLLGVADLLMEKVRQRIEAVDPMDMGSQEFRHLSATIKDLKEIQMIRSDADLREQEARIASLRRQADKDSASRDVVVEMSEEVDALSG
jgi:hypothetical protein